MLPRLPPLAARVVVVPIVMAGVLRMMSALSAESRPAEGQAAPITTTRAIRSISTEASGPALVIAIEGTGDLPLPTSGAADEPPRVYFDFPGVALKAAGITLSTDPRIRRIRAGVHSAIPLVTRVVLDLVAPLPYRVERAEGRVSVIVGGSATQSPPGIAPLAAFVDRPPASSVSPEPSPEPPVAAAAVPREPAPSLKQSPPTPPPAPPIASAHAAAALSSAGQLLPIKDLERYRPRVSPALDRLRLQQPLLTSLDGAEDQTVERVQLAVEEFERLKQELAGIKPPATLRSQHDMLCQVTTLALMATRLRLEAFRTSDPATIRNAASAAAGATLLLDRACADLGCRESRR
jgi:hypothetical protein